MLNERRSGLLLPIFSLPSEEGQGNLGPAAWQFVDFLKQAGQTYWQVLPLNPVDGIYGHSPYSSYSLFAGNEALVFGDHDRPKKFEADWLDDYALFCVIKKLQNGRSWSDWPDELRDRRPAALKTIAKQYREAIEAVKKRQYLFFQQWRDLRWHAKRQGIKIIGDLPIYPCHDSADVWSNQELFKLSADKKPAAVAGVPPDYFSKTGQLWGNPVYDWDKLKQTGYRWWLQRLAHNLELFDVVRLDHFRGFSAFWEVPYGEETAVNGRWVSVPSSDFFSVVKKKLPRLELIAEDLGIITDDVKELMKKFQIPGMRILLFAFGDDDHKHPYLPQNFPADCVAYTGTHDNNTVRGWFEEEAGEAEKERLFRSLGRSVEVAEAPWALIELAMKSKANTVIIPVQDLLGLGSEARLNVPSQTHGNWQWQLKGDALSPGLAGDLAALTKSAGRWGD